MSSSRRTHRQRFNVPQSVYLFTLIGEAIGFASQDAILTQNVEDCLNRIGWNGDQEFIVHHVDYGDPYENQGARDYTNSTTLREIITELEWDYSYGRRIGTKDIRSLDDALYQYTEICEDEYGRVLSVCTPEAHEAKVREEKRKELEGVAGEVARAHGVRVDSIEFINAIHQEIDKVRDQREHWNNPEVRAEQYAAHLYNGTRDVYWDDLNFENGRYDSRSEQLFDILDWLGEECPLLLAKWNESQVVAP